MPGSTHASIGALTVPLAQGCASCHEGGLAHAQSGGKKSLVQSMRAVSAPEQARLCLSCHRDSDKLQHVTQGAHLRHNVGCLECHAPVHGADPNKVTWKAEENCKRCHADVQAQFALPNHHPVPEGRMQCTSCHDVHGDMARVRNLELTQDRCLQCHKNYQGPFVFAHQASRRDGCIVCHLPHGTPNQRLLQQVNSQQNCLQCHGDFPAFHDQTRGAVFTDCLRCHTQVHGSNHSRYLFR
jgi:DmsE family decaheme c-type cytochrome